MTLLIETSHFRLESKDKPEVDRKDGGGWVDALFVSYQIGTDVYQVPQNLASFLQSHEIVQKATQALWG